MAKTRVGKISHYFSKIGVAVVEVEAPLKVGDKISIEGGTTKFEQTVSSMQVDREAIKSAKKGDSVGMKVDSEVKPGDVVYKL
ncbi:MAG: translation elongation factor-like protein [Candidatus Nanoarchaeia archaeon]|nr:translation elongation factor-like protein [Candidatus Nanoarchaeia archaeon]MDD5239552.1 translation elongation factor-like protein [Candidatus Nanoarchaeia archaeon]